MSSGQPRDLTKVRKSFYKRTTLTGVLRNMVKVVIVLFSLLVLAPVTFSKGMAVRAKKQNVLQTVVGVVAIYMM